MYGNQDGSIPASYRVLYFIGWKPDPSQVTFYLLFFLIKKKESYICRKAQLNVVRQMYHSRILTRFYR
jgi:hypothetical protein